MTVLALCALLTILTGSTSWLDRIRGYNGEYLRDVPGDECPGYGSTNECEQSKGFSVMIAVLAKRT